MLKWHYKVHILWISVSDNQLVDPSRGRIADIRAQDATRCGTQLQVYILFYGTTLRYSDANLIKSMGYGGFVVKIKREVLKMG